MINGLIAIGYKDLWDDYDTVDPLSLLKDVPTVGVLEFFQRKKHFRVVSCGFVESPEPALRQAQRP